ncbi:hypothetical protein RvY_18759-2 [Ramazzottius varieornatus]|nr:hypothetical protein RvY_18759-2 [Ramazzottius varieornatus]
MFQRASVQIVVYKTMVNFAVADVFRFRTEQADSYADEFNKSIIPIGFNKSFFVMTQDLVPAMDMKKKQQRYHSVAAIHFAMKSLPFRQPRLNWMYREMRRFPAPKLDGHVEGLLRR